MRLWLAHCISLTDRVKLFKQHWLGSFASKMEQNCPGFGFVQFVQIDVVVGVEVRVDKQMLCFSVQLCYFPIPILHVFNILLVWCFQNASIITFPCFLMLNLLGRYFCGIGVCICFHLNFYQLFIWTTLTWVHNRIFVLFSCALLNWFFQVQRF